MDINMLIGIIGFAVLLVMIFMRVWVGFALIIAGFAGLWVLRDFNFALNVIGNHGSVTAPSADPLDLRMIRIAGNQDVPTQPALPLYNPMYFQNKRTRNVFISQPQTFKLLVNSLSHSMRPDDNNAALNGWKFLLRNGINTFSLQVIHNLFIVNDRP